MKSEGQRVEEKRKKPEDTEFWSSASSIRTALILSLLFNNHFSGKKKIGYVLLFLEGRKYAVIKEKFFLT